MQVKPDAVGVRGAGIARVSDHYASHLAPIYLWMSGGMEAALTAGAADMASFLPGTGLALDLGAGFGMHSIPMARAGYRVVAVDQSSVLLQLLERHRGASPVETVHSDLLEFRKFVSEPAQLIVCMGDTLTHLDDLGQVGQLFDAVADALSPTGRFVATFRDYSLLAAGERRFIPVRSDRDRILTCLLEESQDCVVVHDIVHERASDEWHLKVSGYRKLKLAPAAVARALGARGLATHIDPGPRGMVRLVGSRSMDIVV